MAISRSVLTICLATLFGGLATGCATNPTMGGSSGNAASGGAAGASSTDASDELEHCDAPLGTLAVYEDQREDWWRRYRSKYPDLGSTTPVLRTIVQQSNCFVIVERGQAMRNMEQERELMDSGELREGSNLGKGQMVAADYTMTPSIQFSEKDTGGLQGAVGGLFGSTAGAIAGGMSKNEAATTLLLTDNRSGVQVSSSVGNAANMDFNLGGGFFSGLGAGARGYTDTPQGKVLTAAFMDSYNQMVRSLRNYQSQEVEGGLGRGGQLEVGD
ncbi:MAG: CsgG/HfaB family protein [Pseudomonadota bacterium]